MISRGLASIFGGIAVLGLITVLVLAASDRTLGEIGAMERFAPLADPARSSMILLAAGFGLAVLASLPFVALLRLWPGSGVARLILVPLHWLYALPWAALAVSALDKTLPDWAGPWQALLGAQAMPALVLGLALLPVLVTGAAGHGASPVERTGLLMLPLILIEQVFSLPGLSKQILDTVEPLQVLAAIIVLGIIASALSLSAALICAAFRSAPEWKMA